MAPKKKLWRPLDAMPPRTRQGNSRVPELVNDFLASGATLGEVEKWAKPASVTAALRSYIVKNSVPLAVRTVGDRVILVKTRGRRA